MRTVIILSIIFVTGCFTSRRDPTPCVIFDEVYGDYYSHGVWTPELKDAQVMPEWKAELWLYDFRTHERGEYADTGDSDYPIKVIHYDYAQERLKGETTK